MKPAVQNSSTMNPPGIDPHIAPHVASDIAGPADCAANITRSAQIISLCELEQGGDGEGTPLLDTVHPLLRIKTRVQVCVGSVEMSVAALLDARQDQIVQLDRQVGEPVDLLVEGKVVARGQLVAVDERFAVRITELPLALSI